MTESKKAGPRNSNNLMKHFETEVNLKFFNEMFRNIVSIGVAVTFGLYGYHIYTLNGNIAILTAGIALLLMAGTLFLCNCIQLFCSLLKMQSLHIRQEIGMKKWLKYIAVGFLTLFFSCAIMLLFMGIVINTSSSLEKNKAFEASQSSPSPPNN
jgi:hypothetical protein